jgi:hypothetical protein
MYQNVGIENATEKEQISCFKFRIAIISIVFVFNLISAAIIISLNEA